MCLIGGALVPPVFWKLIFKFKPELELVVINLEKFHKIEFGLELESQ